MRWKGSYGHERTSTARSESESRMSNAVTPAEKKRPTWMVGGATILSFVALLYIIEVIDGLSGHRFDQDGIRPLEVD